MEARLSFTGDAGYLTVIVTHKETDVETSVFNCAANKLVESSFEGYTFYNIDVISATETHYFAALED